MFGLMRARTSARHTDTWRQWRNHYCGTCKTIGARYGQAARMSLSHDTVFLAELLTALESSAAPSAIPALSPIPARDSKPSRDRQGAVAAPSTKPLSPAYRSFNCMTLPKTEDEQPTILRYSAAATLVLTEFKVIDHIEDTNRRRWRTLARLFSKAFRKAEQDLNALDFPTRELRASLSQQAIKEKEGTTLHDFATPTAEATQLFFAHGAKLINQPPESLETLGARFGQLAYILDAYEDYEKDEKAGAFNAIRKTQTTKAEAILQLQALVNAIKEDLAKLPLDPSQSVSFASRLQANIDAKLGLHICQPRKTPKVKQSRKQRWDKAVAFARTISEDSPKWRAGITIASVALIAYLAPAHSKAATTPSECLSLSFNLMALGGIFAMASTPPLPPVDPSVNPGSIAAAAKAAHDKANAGKGSGGCCGGGCGKSCGCDDCCCDSCDCCICEALSCECCSGCGECGSCCGGCGDCCGSCGDCGSCCDC